MSGIPEPIRRAMLAAGADVEVVEAALSSGEDPIPPDEDVVAAQAEEHDWRAQLQDDGEALMTEQPALWGDEPTPISYETLLPPLDVAAYKRVKAATMRIADDAREIVAGAVGGTIGDGSRSGKQFIATSRGKYRLATSTQSDNSTEVAAHERMGVETIHLSEPAEMIAWFEKHGLDGRVSYDRLVRDLRMRYRA